jgi:Zn-dependent protease
MLNLLANGQYGIFVLLIAALVLSLSIHEYGHALVAKWFGDSTAEKAGRLTINPVAHVDPIGFAMVVVVGFGYAKPVPTDPRNYSRPSADLWIAAAGPFMNFMLAFGSWNLYLFASANGWQSGGADQFFAILALINLMLMLFNMIPLGPLDGHYMLPYFLSETLAARYRFYNERYGTALFLALILLSVAGLPIFSSVIALAQRLMNAIIIF